MQKIIFGSVMAMLLAHGANAALITQDFTTCATFAPGKKLSTNISPCGFSANSATAVNVRTAGDLINTDNNNNSFKNSSGVSLFKDNFLVIGDDVGNIANSPNGNNGNVTTKALYSLGELEKGIYNFVIGFDYVVDTNAATSTDAFNVQFETGSGTFILNSNVLNLVNISQNSAQYRKKGFSTPVNFTLDDTGFVNLSFSLLETSSSPTGSSAAGIDNLTIQQIPEPGSLALGALALLSLAAVRRRT